MSRNFRQNRFAADRYELRFPSEKTKDKCHKQCVYLSNDVIAEMREEALRQGRGPSWLLRQAWKIAKSRLRTFPASDVSPEP